MGESELLFFNNFVYFPSVIFCAGIKNSNLSSARCIHFRVCHEPYGHRRMSRRVKKRQPA